MGFTSDAGRARWMETEGAVGRVRESIDPLISVLQSIAMGHVVDGKAHLRARGKMSVRAVVFPGWDEHSQLVLAVVFTGCIPLSVANGIFVGYAWTAAPEWGRACLGLGAFAGTFISLLSALAWCGRSRWFRNWFIPFARWMFPPSKEVASRSG